MQQFLRDFFEEVETVDLDNGVTHEPSAKFDKKRETLVGVMPNHLKRFFVAYSQFCEDTQKHRDEDREKLVAIGNKPRSEATAEELALVQLHVALHLKTDIVQDLFWLAVKETFPALLITPDVVGLRSGWRVVTFPQEKPQIEAVLFGMVHM